MYPVVNKNKKQSRQNERRSTYGTGLQLALADRPRIPLPVLPKTSDLISFLTVENLGSGEDMIKLTACLAKEIEQLFAQKVLIWRQTIAGVSTLKRSQSGVESHYLESVIRVTSDQLNEYYRKSSDNRYKMESMEKEFITMLEQSLTRMQLPQDVVKKMTERGSHNLIPWLGYVIKTNEGPISNIASLTHGLANLNFLHLLFSAPEYLSLSLTEVYRKHFSSLMRCIGLGLDERNQPELAREFRSIITSGDLEQLRKFWSQSEAQLARSLLVMSGHVAELHMR